MREIKEWIFEHIHPCNITGSGHGAGIYEAYDWYPIIRVDVPYLTDETNGRVSGACVWYKQKDTCFPRQQTAARMLESIESTGCGQPLMIDGEN